MTAAPCLAQNVTVNNDLSFGAVYPGIPKVVDKAQAGMAAEFYVSGTPGAEVAIDLYLPRYVNLGGFNMKTIFRETDCAVDTSATPDQSIPLFDDLDPWHRLTYRLGSNGLTLWLGGTVIPDLQQGQGSYSGLLEIRVEYTGN